MTSSPQPLPSLPPSPNTEHAPLPAPIPLATRKHEEDIAQAWHEDEPTITDVEHLNPHARKKSRKGKERAGSESDEDEEEKDARRALKKMGKRRANVVLDSDEEMELDDDVICGAKPDLADMPMGDIKTMSRFLPSTKMKVRSYVLDFWAEPHSHLVHDGAVD